MGGIGEELTEILENKISFVIPIFGGIPVPNAVVVSWIIMAVLVILSIIFVRNLQIKPTKPQLVIETIVGGLDRIIGGVVGEHGRRYIPYLSTVGLYLVCANLIGVLGISPPTRNLNTTAALALMSIFLIQYAAIRQKKVSGWLKGFAKPIAFIAPINILELFVRPLSLCMRLFGNVLGAFIIMELIKLLVPILVPVPFSIYFDIFDGLIQAYIFVFLTSMFIGEAIE